MDYLIYFFLSAHPFKNEDGREGGKGRKLEKTLTARVDLQLDHFSWPFSGAFLSLSSVS